MGCVGGGRSSSARVEWCSAPQSIPFGAPSAAVSHWHAGSNVPPPPWSPSIAQEWLSEQKPFLGEDGHRRPEQIKNIAQRLLLRLWRELFPNFSIIACPLYDLTRKRASWDWALVCKEVLKLLGFETGIYKALGPIHPEDSLQAEWGFSVHGLSNSWQHGPVDPTHPIQFQFHSHSFKNA